MSDLPLPRRASSFAISSAILSPNALLALFCVGLAVLLVLVRTLPLGAMYWDLFIYFDAAKRIFDGQVPAADFFAPVGPLGYWLFAGGLKLFPNAQPLLLVDWSLLVVTAPLMAVVLSDVARRSRGQAFALLVPFLLFSALPFNVETFSSFPGADGFGIYNRQGARLLYVLASALLFCEAPRRMGLVVAGAMLALFLTKITGFIAGGLLCAVALLAGRVKIATACGIAVVFLGALTVLQATTGVVAPYLKDVATLVSMNQGEILARFLQAASVHFGVFLPCAALTAVLLAFGGKALATDTRAFLRKPGLRPLGDVFDHSAVWMGAATFAALFYETQNTGSQAFIFVWPALLLVLTRTPSRQDWHGAVVVTLVAASALPTGATVVERAARAFIGALRYERIEAANLGSLGAVTQRPELLRRADLMLDVYARNPDFYRAFVAAGELPSHTLYAEQDYQLAFLKTLDEAVEAVNLYEIANDVRFDSVMNIGFVNPFPYLLDRHAPRFVSIGADPSRTVPPPSEAVAEAIRGTDLLLYSKCPETAANHDILKLYEPFLAQHRRVSFGRCWDGFVRNDLVE